MNADQPDLILLRRLHRCPENLRRNPSELTALATSSETYARPAPAQVRLHYDAVQDKIRMLAFDAPVRRQASILA